MIVAGLTGTGMCAGILGIVKGVTAASRGFSGFGSGMMLLGFWLSWKCYGQLLRWLFFSHMHIPLSFPSSWTYYIYRRLVYIHIKSLFLLSHALPWGCSYPCSCSTLLLLSGVGFSDWSLLCSLLVILTHTDCYRIRQNAGHPLYFPVPQPTPIHLHRGIPGFARLFPWPFLFCPKCLIPLDGTPSQSLSLSSCSIPFLPQ